MTRELRPCPFCGGEAMLSTYYDFYKVHCNSDDCWAEVSVGDAYNGVGKWYGSVDEAIAAWNIRAERTCHPVTVDVSCCEDATACSACGKVDSDLSEYDYCPWCGAKVVEE